MKYLQMADFKKVFDPILEAAIEEKIKESSRYTEDAYIRDLLAYPLAMLKAGGKRVRPYVAYLMYTAGGGVDEKVFQSLVAIELFQLFCLVHDDIIDEGISRHGIPTMQRYALATPSCRGTVSKRIGDAQALLVGDMIFAWAEDTLAARTPSERLRNVSKIFHEMINAVVVGQMIDSKLMDHEETTMREVLQKTELKTAHYTFIHPMRMGAALAGASTPYDAFCFEFGKSLGIAYQIQDDILDIIGDPQKTGKKNCSDVREGQHTALSQYIFERGSDEHRSALLSVFRSPLSEEEIVWTREIFVSSGAIDFGYQEIERYVARAREELVSSKLDAEARAIWNGLIERIEHRSA